MIHMQVKRILVTGGCGAIGSEVINWLKARYPGTFFINLDALTYAGKEEHIEPMYHNYKFIKGDICDFSLVTKVLYEERPDCIIHFAAETHVDNSFGNSFRFTQTNVYGTHCLLECVRQYINDGHKFDVFFHMSTDEVYGSVSDTDSALLETALFSPSNPYSATKAAAEMICHAYQKSFKIPIIISRCNNAISKYQHREKLIPNVINSILEGKKIPVHGNGESKRTFIHSYDIAKAIETIITKGVIGNIYNIGTENEYNVLQVVEKILAIMSPGKTITDVVEFVEDRAFQDYRYFIDSTALRKLGWHDEITFDDAVRNMLEYYTRAK